MGADSIRLFWYPEFNDDVSDGVIAIKATSTSGPKFGKSASAYLYQEEVTLEGLTPNTSYIVTATARLGENRVVA